jgi:hypothetical protein
MNSDANIMLTDMMWRPETAFVQSSPALFPGTVAYLQLPAVVRYKLEKSPALPAPEALEFRHAAVAIDPIRLPRTKSAARA